MLPPMAENVIHFFDSELFFSFIVVIGFSRGKEGKITY